MNSLQPIPAGQGDDRPLTQLVRNVLDDAVRLAKKEVELAKLEIKADLASEAAMAKGLGIAGVCALMTLAMLLMACAVALAHLVAAWLAPLIVAAAVLAVGTVAGLAGWGRRVRSPLEATRRTLKENAQWAKERMG